jgi:hypothetical protein
VGYGSKGGSALTRILLVVVMAVLIVAVSAMPALALAIGTTRCEKNGNLIIRPLGENAIRLLEAKRWNCTPDESSSSVQSSNVQTTQDSGNDDDLEDIDELGD